MGSTSSSIPTSSVIALGIVVALCAAGCAPGAPTGSSPDPPGAKSPATEEPVAVSGLSVELFVRGELFSLGADGDRSIGKVPRSVAGLGPPLHTAEGVLVEVGSSGDPLEIWLVGLDGSADLLAPSTQGMAVSPDGSRFAYAAIEAEGQATYGSATLVLARLPDGEPLASSSPVDGYARVEGFVGEQVMVSMGDGAGTGVAVWDPSSSGALTPLEGYRSVLATDPPGAQAVLTRGDGPCWSVVRIEGGGGTKRAGPAACDGLEGADFSSDGQLLAGVAAGDDGERLVLYRLWEADPALDLGIDGAMQALWVSSSRVLVLAQDGGSHTIHRCSLEGAPCEAVWSGRTGATGYGEVWLAAGG
jgi:hypothetical protein